MAERQLTRCDVICRHKPSCGQKSKELHSFSASGDRGQRSNRSLDEDPWHMHAWHLAGAGISSPNFGKGERERGQRDSERRKMGSPALVAFSPACPDSLCELSLRWGCSLARAYRAGSQARVQVMFSCRSIPRELSQPTSRPAATNRWEEKDDLMHLHPNARFCHLHCTSVGLQGEKSARDL